MANASLLEASNRGGEKPLTSAAEGTIRGGADNKRARA